MLRPPSSELQTVREHEFSLPTDVFSHERYSGSSYLECRLGRGHNGAQLDHLVAIPLSAAATASRTLEAALARVGGPLPSDWAPILSYLRSWAGGNSLASGWVGTTWLEFDDIGEAGSQPLVPSLSVGLIPGYRVDRTLAPAAPQMQQKVIAEALALLELGPQAEVIDTLADCFRLLPAGASWIHFSAMLGRPTRALKLYGEFQRDTLFPYLAALGHAGDLSALQSVIDLLYPRSLLGDRVFVDVNVTTCRDASRCSLGVAVSQQHALLSGADPRRKNILDLWQSHGLCEAHKRAAILEWLDAATPSAGRFGRFLDLKLVWQVSEAWTAKAYLGSPVPADVRQAFSLLQCERFRNSQGAPARIE